MFFEKTHHDNLFRKWQFQPKWAGVVQSIQIEEALLNIV